MCLHVLSSEYTVKPSVFAVLVVSYLFHSNLKIFCIVCVWPAFVFLGEWEFIGSSVCRGSHRCECHVTEVKKGKVRVFSCQLRSQ